jgi:hypothetical protein
MNREEQKNYVYTNIIDKLNNITFFHKDRNDPRDRFTHRTAEEFDNDNDRDKYYYIAGDNESIFTAPLFRQEIEGIKTAILQMLSVSEWEDITKKNEKFRVLKYFVEDFEKNNPKSKGGRHMSYRNHKLKTHKKSKYHRKIKKGKRTKRRRY